MAEFQAASWTQLVEALGECSDEEFDTITITKNIDCAVEIPDGVEATIAIPPKTIIRGNYELHGVMKHRRIRNLRTHTTDPVNVFAIGNQHVHFIGIDFEDMILDKPLLFRNDSFITALVQCRFSGQRTDNLFHVGGLGSIKCVLKSCYFDVVPTSDITNPEKIPLFSTSLAWPNAFSCRFHETYSNWSTDISYELSTKYMNLSGCYIDGTYVFGDKAEITTNYNYLCKIQNAVNLDLKTTAEPGTIIDVKAPRGIWNCRIQGFNNPISYLYNNINSGGAIPELGVDMTNAVKLYNDGFDISVT